MYVPCIVVTAYFSICMYLVTLIFFCVLLTECYCCTSPTHVVWLFHSKLAFLNKQNFVLSFLHWREKGSAQKTLQEKCSKMLWKLCTRPKPEPNRMVVLTGIVFLFSSKISRCSRSYVIFVLQSSMLYSILLKIRKGKRPTILCFKRHTHRYTHTHLFFTSPSQNCLALSVIYTRNRPNPFPTNLHIVLLMWVGVCACLCVSEYV